MAAQWIHEFVKLAGNEMLPHMPGILSAQLPNMVFDDERRRNMTEDQYKRKVYAQLLVGMPYYRVLVHNNNKQNRNLFYVIFSNHNRNS